MNPRRILVSSVVIALFGGAIAAARTEPIAQRPSFGQPPVASRPYLAMSASAITTTWFCPGIPAADETTGGQVVVSNSSEVKLQGRLSLFGADGVLPVYQDISIDARGTLSIDVPPLLRSSFVTAMVELDGGSGIVEQRAIHPAGNTITSCTPSTSQSWYFADGFTVDGSNDQIVLSNPYADVAIVDLTFYKGDKPINPAALQDYPIAARSVKVISLADVGAKDEPSLAVSVIASRGRFVAAKAQHYFGGGRLGYSLALGAPRLAEQLYFAEGEAGPGITETYSIFNPTGEDVLLEPTVLGVPITDTLVNPDAIPVPANSVVSFDATAIQGMPVGQHTMVFSTLAQASVVIERVITKIVDDKPVTTVVQGMTPEYVVQRWHVPIGVDQATDNALVIYNVDGVATTVAVKQIGPGGEVAIPGLEAVPLPSSGVITISVTESSAFGRPLVVESVQRLLVERLVPTGAGSGRRAGLWAVPECGPCNFSSLPSS